MSTPSKARTPAQREAARTKARTDLATAIRALEPDDRTAGKVAELAGGVLGASQGVPEGWTPKEV